MPLLLPPDRHDHQASEYRESSMLILRYLLAPSLECRIASQLPICTKGAGRLCVRDELLTRVEGRRIVALRIGDSYNVP